MHEIGELARLGGESMHVIELEGFSGVLDEVQHVIHPGDQAMDFFAIERGHERPVKQCDGLVSHSVSTVLELQYAGDTLFAFVLLACEASQKLDEHDTGGDYQ